MLSKFEMIGVGVSIAIMAVALYMVRVETTVLSSLDTVTQTAAVQNTAAVVVAPGGEDNTTERTSALLEAADSRGNLKKLVIEDVVIGTGDAVVSGNTVQVHYVGTLQSGEEFDSSLKRGEPFSFTVGEGRVIKGWEEGLVGMKVGGKRLLVIPPAMAYGDRPVGPIPPNSTLVFSIELLAIN